MEQDERAAVDDGDRALWDSVLIAERELRRRRAEFAERAASRSSVLSAALNGSAADRAAALAFLDSFHQDVPALVDPLVELATSDSWSRQARQALTHGITERVRPRVAEIIQRRLPTMDAIDYARLIQLLVDLRDWPTLRLVAQSAAAHEDPDARKLGQDLQAQYGPMLSATTG